MPEQTRYTGEEVVNPETAHESSDVNVRALIWFFIIFVVFAIITHLVLWGFYKMLVKSETRRGAPPMTSVARPSDASVPQNQPLLQPFPRESETGEVIAPNRNTPVTDLVDMRRAEENVLTTYDWVNKEQGVVRIPIEVAKDLVVQRGLPVQAPVAAPVPPVPVQRATP